MWIIFCRNFGCYRSTRKLLYKVWETTIWHYNFSPTKYHLTSNDDNFFLLMSSLFLVSLHYKSKHSASQIRLPILHTNLSHKGLFQSFTDLPLRNQRGMYAKRNSHSVDERNTHKFIWPFHNKFDCFTNFMNWFLIALHDEMTKWRVRYGNDGKLTECIICKWGVWFE